MAKWGDQQGTSDPKYFQRMKTAGEECRFRIVTMEVGRDAFLHYVPRTGSPYDMGVPCLDCVGGTQAECMELQTPAGKPLHECNGDGNHATRRRRLLVWSYDVPNEITKTTGRPQILTISGPSEGEIAQINEIVTDEGDFRVYDLRRVCYKRSDSGKFATRCRIKLVKDSQDNSLSPPDSATENKEAAKKFFVSFLKSLHQKTSFITSGSGEMDAREILGELVKQWEECWDTIAKPVNTVEGVKQLLRIMADGNDSPDHDTSTKPSTAADDIFAGSAGETKEAKNGSALEDEIFGDGDAPTEEKAADPPPATAETSAESIFDAEGL